MCVCVRAFVSIRACLHGERFTCMHFATVATFVCVKNTLSVATLVAALPSSSHNFITLFPDHATSLCLGLLSDW